MKIWNMPLEQITTEMDVQEPQSKLSKLKAMMKRKAQMAETEAEGRELDRTVASPYKMALAQKEKDALEKAKTEKYKSEAIGKINGFAGTKEDIRQKITALPDRIMIVKSMKKK